MDGFSCAGFDAPVLSWLPKSDGLEIIIRDDHEPDVRVRLFITLGRLESVFQLCCQAQARELDELHRLAVELAEFPLVPNPT